MKTISALFVGMYPNSVSPYRNVFFQNLIFALADIGVECTVISPVPVTKYGINVLTIDHKEKQKTSRGSIVEVYYPRYVSVSSKKIGKYNTEKLSEHFFEDSVIRLVKQLDKSFDFVYGHFFLYGGLAAIRVGKYLGIPSYLAFGECDFDSQIKNTYGIPRDDQLVGLKGIISVSTKNTNELNRLGIVDGVPILTAPNSVDLDVFHEKDKTICRNELGIPNDIFVVGFVGGFIERKGDKRLLAAVNNLDDVYVAFAGKGTEKPSGEKVVYCDSIDHDRISVFLNAIDVFCLPTLSEGCCNSIIEAMACGKPIISSDLPFNDDILDGTNSIRINPYSIDDIANAISLLKNDRELRNHLHIGSINYSKKLSIESRANTIISFIEKTISESEL